MGAKLKYDVSGVEPGDSLNHAKPGMYRAKVKEVTAKDSKSSGNPMLEIVFEVLPKKKKYAQVWYYIVTGGDNPQEGRLREFLEAVGEVKKGAKKAKGALDPDKLVGTEVQIQLKSDTDQDGDYRPRVGKVLGTEDEIEEPDTDEDEDEDDDTDDEDDESTDEDDDESDDDDDDDEDDDDDDDDEDDDEDDDVPDFSSMNVKELEAEVEEYELDLEEIIGKGKKAKKGAAKKKALIEALEEAAGDEDYSEWEVADLKSELKERGLSTKGKKDKLVERLEEDDADDEDPFDDDDEDDDE